MQDRYTLQFNHNANMKNQMFQSMAAKSFVLSTLIVALCACNKSGLTPTTATLYCGDSIQLSFDGEPAVGLASNAPFVASVSETGYVRANHVGQTRVLPAMYSNVGPKYGLQDECNVTVMPRYTYYEEPQYQYIGQSQADVIAAVGQPASVQNIEGDIFLTYGDIDKDDYVVTYAFSDNRMYAAQVVHKTLTEKQLREFLNERFSFAGYDDTTQEYLYLNADTEDAATLLVLAYFSEGAWEIVYHKFTSADKI